MIRNSFKVLFIIFVLQSITACVTETTGGFREPESEAKAVNDYVQLGLGYYKEGNAALARKNLKKALELNPSSAGAHNVLALVYQKERDLDLAEKHYKKAIRYDGKLSKVRNNYAAFLFSQGRYKEAYKQLKEVVKDTDYNKRAIAFQNLGLCALRLNKKKEAKNAFERALHLDNYLVRPLLELAEIEINNGRVSEANVYLTQFLHVTGSKQTPRTLLIGLKISNSIGDKDREASLALLLRNLYPHSVEYKQYKDMKK